MSGEAMETDIPYVICSMSDIPSQRALGFYLSRIGDDGEAHPWPIVVVRWGRHAFAYLNRCPHNGVRLDWERDQFFDAYGTGLMCGKHGARFDLSTGECIEGPCVGARLEPIPVSVIDGDICVIGVRLVEDEEDVEGTAEANG
jgi:nitrite reductase/ring-hydroxylating ferredoxin subunit